MCSARSIKEPAEAGGSGQGGKPGQKKKGGKAGTEAAASDKGGLLPPDALTSAKSLQRDILEEMTTCAKLRMQLNQYELSADLASQLRSIRKEMNKVYTQLTALIDEGINTDESYEMVYAEAEPIRKKYLSRIDIAKSMVKAMSKKPSSASKKSGGGSSGSCS